jgi:hypothetical protein
MTPNTVIIVLLFATVSAYAQTGSADTVGRKNKTIHPMLKQYQSVQHPKLEADSSSTKFVHRRDSVKLVLKGLKDVQHPKPRLDTVKVKQH